MELALASWLLWMACRLLLSFACRSKIVAFGCPQLTAEKIAWDCQLSGLRSLRAYSMRWLGVWLPGQRKERKEPMTQHSSIESSITISTDVNLVSVHELFEHTQDVFDLIARRAFEIFESRGRLHGNDREDWFLAESELLTPVKFHLSESGGRLTARAEVAGFNRQEIKVSLEPRRLSISGKTKLSEDDKAGKHPHSHRHAQLMFHVIDLPTEVDLSASRASLNDGRLEVVMPKAVPAKSVQLHGASEAADVDSSSDVDGAIEPKVKAQPASTGR
jgi:HSP20 family protein